MILFTLDKKLQTVNHRITKQELQSISTSHSVEVPEIEKDLKRQMLIKFLPLLEKSFDVTTTEDNETKTYTVRGYILSERQLYETMLEVLDLNDDDKVKLTKSIYNYLGIYSQK